MIETLLQEAASIEDEQRRDQIIRELATHSDETLAALIDILQRPMEALWEVAVQVIRVMGYPQNASAIPALTVHARDRNSPARSEAFQALVDIGPWAVVPSLLKVKEDDAIDDLIYDLLVEAGRRFWALDEQEKEQLIQELVSHPDEALGVVTYILQNALKEWWEAAVRIIRAIGYPRNASAIPVLVAHVGYGNPLTEDEAIQALVEIGPRIVVPSLLQVMWDRGQTNKSWGNDVAGICSMLCKVDRQFAVQCGPVATYLLSRFELPQKPGLALLSVLEKIGANDIEYALPTLIDLVQKEGTSEVGMQARRFLASFDEKSLEPYQLLLASLEEPRGEGG